MKHITWRKLIENLLLTNTNLDDDIAVYVLQDDEYFSVVGMSQDSDGVLDVDIMFTASEKKIIKEVRAFVKNSTKVYNFCFVYDISDVAINFEGGYELSEFPDFRNDYYIKPGKYQRIMRTPTKIF